MAQGGPSMTDPAAGGAPAGAVAAGDAPAAAVAAEGAPAAAVAASPEDLEQMRVKQHFQLNNIALKWIRDTYEDPPGHPTTRCVDLANSDPLQIGAIDKHTGMSYRFKEGEFEPWSWR